MNYTQAIKEIKEEMELEFEKAMHEIEKKTEQFKSYVENQDGFEYIISQGGTLENLRSEYRKAHLIAKSKQEVLDEIERKIMKERN